MPEAVPLIDSVYELDEGWGNYLNRLVGVGKLAAAVARWRVPHGSGFVTVGSGRQRRLLDEMLKSRAVLCGMEAQAWVMPGRRGVVCVECDFAQAGLYVLAGKVTEAEAVVDVLGPVADRIRDGLTHSSGVLRGSAAGAVLESILEGWRFPALVVSREGFVVFGNRVARALESSGEAPFYESADGRLLFGAEEGNAAFRVALQEAWGGDGDEVRRIVDDNVLISVRCVDCAGGMELAVVTLRSLASKASLRIREVGTLLGLTPAQTKVALAIFDGKSVKEFAAENQTAITTVRWHLQQVLHRVGCRNQVELVRFLWQLI